MCLNLSLQLTQTVIQKKGTLYSQENNNQQIQRRGEGGYIATFTLHSFTTSWERGVNLTTYQLCVIEVKSYGTLVMLHSGGGVSTHL